jgi:chorismate-pyruvate lyase
MVESADTPLPVPSSAMWLPGTALNCYESDPAVRDWLLTPGLLTQRIKSAAGSAFVMHVLGEHLHEQVFIREIDMCCGMDVWLFAHTRVPRATALNHPWLTTIGDRSLGEALGEHGHVERAAFRYAKLQADVWLVERALRHAKVAPTPLWVRHSAFALGSDGFDLYEVFLPQLAQQ